MKHFVQHTLFPLLAAMIWGFAFSAQSVCSKYLPPFAVNAVRSLIAFLILATACYVLKLKIGNRKLLLPASLVCGGALFAASNFQQFGIGETSAGKSGFISALYLVLVPILSSMVFHKKVTRRIWFAVILAVFGMAFLCLDETFTVNWGDLALLACALLFSVQILGIDYYAENLNPVVLSAGQFLVCGLLSLLCSLCFESVSISNIRSCLGSLLYISLFSSCVAYTLQIIAQKGGNATVVTLLMSLESVFALLGGMLLLGEKPSPKELLGCILMAGAIVLTQLPERMNNKNV